MSKISEMRTRARDIFSVGVQAADPYGSVVGALRDTPPVPPAQGGKTLIVSVGKAAMRMAEAALSQIDGPRDAIVVTNYENAAELAGARVFAAGHPVPDENGARAARAVLETLAPLGAGDRVLALISGGGSALLPAPVAGVSLADKAEVNRLLLASGADILQMNLIRQCLSQLKGGGMLRAAAPAPLRALILSDVVGDDLRAIASGPTVAPLGGKPEAIAILKHKNIWHELPQSVRDHLSGGSDETDIAAGDNSLVGSNPISVAAMLRAAPAAIRHPHALEGDVAAAAGEILQSAEKPGTYLFGGETTVHLQGDGLGGRNQELALRLALGAEAAGWQGDWVFLAGGTDGRDGPCDAAGGMVDGATLARMRAAGVDPAASLARNDSYHALKASGDLLMTGATGTNVADLAVLIRS